MMVTSGQATRYPLEPIDPGAYGVLEPARAAKPLALG
jgi:hypothetical protein